jgi:hypothetical protein
VLLVIAAPSQLAGREHGRTVPLADVAVTGFGAPGGKCDLFWIDVGSFNLLLNLPFETGCADMSVGAEWAAGRCRQASHSSKTDNPFVPVSH